MSDNENKMAENNELLDLLGHSLKTGYNYQDGRNTNAPSIIYADADYEIGDGSCGLHASVKSCNEPAIIYVRADALADAIGHQKELTSKISEQNGVIDEMRHNIALLKNEVESMSSNLNKSEADRRILEGKLEKATSLLDDFYSTFFVEQTRVMKDYVKSAYLKFSFNEN